MLKKCILLNQSHELEKKFARCLSICAKDFFSKTNGSILIIFHMQISGKGERQTYTFGPGNMTKMSAISI